MTTYRLTITDDQGTVLDSTDLTADEWADATRAPNDAHYLLSRLNVPTPAPKD